MRKENKRINKESVEQVYCMEVIQLSLGAQIPCLIVLVDPSGLNRLNEIAGLVESSLWEAFRQQACMNSRIEFLFASVCLGLLLLKE